LSDIPKELALTAYPLAEPATGQQAEASHLQEEVTALFGQMRSHLLGYLLAFGLPPYDAEEIVQEVFLALFRHLEAGKPRTNLRAWMFKVAHNLALKHCYNSVRTHEQNIDEHNAEGSEWADPSPNPEEQAQHNQRRRLLRSVLRALPEQDQWCLSLRAEGLRYREIADVLGISLGAVSLSLARSLSRLSRADRG
jgi:RNA polymerase sigma-70 factor (ECF subfamily)